MTSTAPDLQSCSPDELASWLLVHRFENNAIDTASFLLQCTSTLPNAEEISAQLLGGGGDDKNNEMDEEKKEDEDLHQTESNANHETLPPLPPFVTKEQSPLQIEVSCINPRGKFLLSLHRGGIVLVNPKKPEEETLTIFTRCVENVVWFRKAEDYKKIKNGANKSLPGHLVLICFREGEKVMFRKKELNQVCLQLPPYWMGAVEDCEGKLYSESQWWKGLGEALRGSDVGRMIRVHAKMDPHVEGGGSFTFQSEGASGSSTTTEGMPYVVCYHGLNDGVLYPLREGLLFFKPPFFVHRSKLSSISCGRGSGSSRYVDLAVELESKDRIEFSNIAREELGNLNDYIHKVLIPAMQGDVEEGEDVDDDDAVVAAEVVDPNYNSSGDDQQENDESSGDAAEKRCRPSRAASRTARKATQAHFERGMDDSEDDDEEDFGSEDGTDDSDAETDMDEEEFRSTDDEEGTKTDDEDDCASDSGEKKAKKAKL